MTSLDATKKTYFKIVGIYRTQIDQKCDILITSTIYLCIYIIYTQVYYILYNIGFVSYTFYQFLECLVV